MGVKAQKRGKEGGCRMESPAETSKYCFSILSRSRRRHRARSEKETYIRTHIPMLCKCTCAAKRVRDRVFSEKIRLGYWL